MNNPISNFLKEYPILTLIAGLFLGSFLLRTYPSYEYSINSTNPLILDNDFIICNNGEHSGYYLIGHNLSNKNIDFKKLCGRSNGRYIEELYFKYGLENITINSLNIKDNLLPQRENIIVTNSSWYVLEKLRQDWNNVIIRVTDKGRGKIYIWQG